MCMWHVYVHAYVLTFMSWFMFMYDGGHPIVAAASVRVAASALV